MAHQLILYVGEPETGEAFAAAAAARSSYVYLPRTMIEALGMYITYFPHGVVIDMRAKDAAAIYDHLRSVDAKPILLLTDERLAAAYTLPTAAPADAILDTLDRMIAARRAPNKLLRFA